MHIIESKIASSEIDYVQIIIFKSSPNFPKFGCCKDPLLSLINVTRHAKMGLIGTPR